MNNEKNAMITYNGNQITFITDGINDYINLTEMAKAWKYRKSIMKWMRGRQTIDFMVAWEKKHNPKFNGANLGTIKEKGSYAGKSENNPEILIEQVLNEAKIPFEQGDLTELFKNENIAKRTMDFIIPNKENPKIIIESSFLVTTSSGQGDKSKTEGNIRKLIAQYYPNALFIGFVDGIGWYVRKKDLKRHITAYDDVYTFHKSELTRFAAFIHQQFK